MTDSKADVVEVMARANEERLEQIARAIALVSVSEWSPPEASPRPGISHPQEPFEGEKDR